MIPTITKPEITDLQSTTNSDHKLIRASWTTHRPTQHFRNKKRKRTIYLYKDMTQEDWEQFANRVQEKSIQTIEGTQPYITTTKHLNHRWNQMEQAIRSAADTTIPKSQVSPKTFYAFSRKATKLHATLRRINSLLRTLAEDPELMDYRHINREILLINKSAQTELPTNWSDQDTPVSRQQKIIELKKAQRTIRNARKIENNLAHKEEIEKHINKRYNNFAQNTTKMIDSVLNRRTEPVIFHNIKKDDSIITQPKQIKEEIRNHYEQWTKSNPIDQVQWPEWAQEYEPIQTIAPEWYCRAMDPITMDELVTTLSEAPIDKATGPQNISNEMLKHLNVHSREEFLMILNACLELRTVPKSWQRSRIYPISKKQKFSGQLSETRPITLVEHARKILTKILTQRLNGILGKHPILHTCNHVALPNTSTEVPISTITHIIEDAHASKREAWLLCQDISKAYDTIHIPLLATALRRIKIPEQMVELITNIFTNRQNTVITSYGTTAPYHVQDGVDQGETIAPLLWRIYYDPLLTTINKRFTGYQMHLHTRRSSLHLNRPVSVYMDDTV